jgi:hypothetical protein
MKNIFILTVAAIFLISCSRVEPIEIQTIGLEKTALNLEQPAPLKLRATRWVVITPENIDDVWKELEDQKSNLVLFAVTDKGYEEMSVTMAEIRNFINMQRQIIIKYKEYYEPE